MRDMSPDGGHVNLLWTGGWDSTFQLLRLLLVQRCRVTPFYLIDAERPSTGVELRTIRRIKDRLFRDHPHTQELLQPTRYFAVADIAPDPEITGAFQAILRTSFIGAQYDWLARFCKENVITDMQLSIIRGGTVYRIIQGLVAEGPEDAQGVLHIDPSSSSMDGYALFRWFTFPLLNLSKMEMGTIADENGWKEMMAMTWFCHTPTKDMKPCGRCNPCRYAIAAGLGWRIPVTSRMLSLLERSCIRPSRSVAKRLLRRAGLLRAARQDA